MQIDRKAASIAASAVAVVAVGVGGGLAVAAAQGSAPSRSPKLVPAAASPAVMSTTVTVTPATSKTPASPKPSTSKRRIVTRKVTLSQQGAAVTTPSPTDTVSQPPIQDLGPGSTDASGIRRPPIPTGLRSHPANSDRPGLPNPNSPSPTPTP